mmetsp:Transcript_30478/g.68361  ORF Transcript_30478/g.68361 Transcript_30478/m.68361 type:complete len:258 (+) Transcript_30478:991-1764(+)
MALALCGEPAAVHAEQGLRHHHQVLLPRLPGAWHDLRHDPFLRGLCVASSRGRQRGRHRRDGGDHRHDGRLPLRRRARQRTRLGENRRQRGQVQGVDLVLGLERRHVPLLRAVRDEPGGGLLRGLPQRFGAGGPVLAGQHRERRGGVRHHAARRLDRGQLRRHTNIRAQDRARGGHVPALRHHRGVRLRGVAVRRPGVGSGRGVRPAGPRAADPSGPKPHRELLLPRPHRRHPREHLLQAAVPHQDRRAVEVNLGGP